MRISLHLVWLTFSRKSIGDAPLLATKMTLRDSDIYGDRFLVVRIKAILGITMVPFILPMLPVFSTDTCQYFGNKLDMHDVGNDPTSTARRQDKSYLSLRFEQLYISSSRSPTQSSTHRYIGVRNLETVIEPLLR